MHRSIGVPNLALRLNKLPTGVLFTIVADEAFYVELVSKKQQHIYQRVTTYSILLACVCLDLLCIRLVWLSRLFSRLLFFMCMWLFLITVGLITIVCHCCPSGSYCVMYCVHCFRRCRFRINLLYVVHIMCVSHMLFGCLLCRIVCSLYFVGMLCLLCFCFDAASFRCFVYLPYC